MKTVARPMRSALHCKLSRVFYSGAGLVTLLVASSLSLAAQSESGGAALQGVVVDRRGAAVAGATVAIKSVDTGNVRTVTSDGNGRFAAQAIPVGRYKVEAVANGSGVSRIVEVQLTVGQSESVMLTVRPMADKGTQMVVKAGERKLDARESAAAASLLLRSIQELPVRGRAFTDFVQLTLGIVQESDRNGLVIAGQRSIYSNVSIDGADYNNPLQGNQRGGNEPIFFFPLAAVREFQVVHGGATSEVGRTNAGFVNVATRSGTNQWHGELFYQNRNSALTSPDAFGNPADQTQHQFGGSLGGPLKRDRVFHFFSVERNLLRDPFQVTFQPQPVGADPPPDLLALQGPKTATNDVTALFSRTDVNLTSGHMLSVQYNYSNAYARNIFVSSARTDDVAESTNYTRAISSHGIRAGLVSSFSSTRVNELRGQIATDNRDENPNVLSSLINITGFGQIGGPSGRPRRFYATRYQLTDNLSVTKRAHRLRFGVDWNRTPEQAKEENFIDGRYDFSSLANYLARNISRYRGTIAAFNPDDLIYRGTQQDFALFVQDRFPLTRNLMLTAGLRWEAQWNPQPTRPNPAFPQTLRIPNDLTQWQPRLGFAWDVRGTGTTVVRLFAGIYAARTPGTLLQREFTDNGLTTVFLDSRFDPNVLNFLRIPDPLATLPPGVRPAPAKVVGFNPNFRNPRSFQTGAAVEHAFGEAMVVSAEYLRNSTWALQSRLDHNLFPPTIDPTGMPIFPRVRPNPSIGPLSINESGSHEDYNALILTARRRLAHRVQFQAGYVLSRNRDDNSNERSFDRETALNPLDPSLERSYSNHDVRHNFNLTSLINLPRGIVASAVMLAHSALPYTPIIGFDTQNDGNDVNDRAIINGRVAGRNSLRQDSFFDLDLRILKTFQFAGERRLQLFTDFYNVTRNGNKNFGSSATSTFGTPAAPSPTAGVPLSAPTATRFGGPRQVQLGLRFLF